MLVILNVDNSLTEYALLQAVMVSLFRLIDYKKSKILCISKIFLLLVLNRLVPSCNDSKY